MPYPTGDPRRREVRIAPVMTGGTSLAVWMGGATSELYSLLRCDEAPAGSTGEIYSSLVELTQTDPVVDVVTGTSAGGLNGCLLSVAVCLDLPLTEFGELRDTMMATADLSKLLREANEANPPSLLLGEDRFKREIEEVLLRWSRGIDWNAERRPIDLVTTYTAITPLGQGRVDDFGESLNEVTHAGTLQFQHSDFVDLDVLRRIATAAKTSAGIPGVFEPSYLPSGTTDATISGRLDLTNQKSIVARDASRWAIDGGIVVNLPLGEALDRIFRRPAHGIVRRVVLYVCPTPRGKIANEGDPPEPSPSILSNLATVFSAPRAEGVTGDIDAIRLHNQGVRRQQKMRQSFAAVQDAIGGAGAPPGLFDSYRERRTESSIDRVIARRRQAVGALDPSTAAHLRAELRGPRRALLPLTADTFSGGGRAWGWGLAPIEEAASVVLGLLSRGLQLDSQRRDADRAAEAEIGLRYELLATAKSDVHDALESVAAIRSKDDQFWAAELQAEDIDELAGVYDRWPYRPTTELEEELAEAQRVVVFKNLVGSHRAIAAALVSASAALRDIAVAAGAVPPATALNDNVGDGSGRVDSDEPRLVRRVSAAQALYDELRMLSDPSSDDIEMVQRALLRYHFVATLLLDDVISREQPTELMQMSWNAGNQLDPKRSPDDKLVGTEFARLGAFLKPSWRANDWFWGRMDAASRLARLLLDPQRLFELGVSSADLTRKLGLNEPGNELDFLDSGADFDVPDVLPETTAQVVRLLQLRVAREELPRIADAIDESNAAGANEPDDGAFRESVRTAFAEGPPSDEVVTDLVQRLKIGSETVQTEIDSELMRHTLEHGYDVARQALGGTKLRNREGSRAFRWGLRAMRRPILNRIRRSLAE